MMKLRGRDLWVLAAVAALVGCAMTLRVLSRSAQEFPLSGLLRSGIYVALIGAWAWSLWARILQTQVRRYLLAAAGLMMLWLILRTVKYSLENMGAERYLWYGYYLPMLFIPVLAALVAMSLGRPENYRLPRWTRCLYLPPALLFLLVLTNDLHQWVFRFPGGVLSDSAYSYGTGYYLVLAWIVLCGGGAMALILIKCRIPHTRRFLWLPVAPFVLALAYCAAYARKVYWVWLLAGDLTVSLCLFIMTIFECCIHCGLIQSNTGYEALFAAAAMRVRLTDRDFYVHAVSSRVDRTLPRKTLRQAAGGEAVLLDEHTLLRGHPIRRGYVFWEEDITELAAVTRQLQQTREELRDAGDILKEESAQRARWLRLTEENRLYDLMERDTRRQVALLNDCLTRLAATEDQDQARRLLGKIVVVGTYIKRRSNLIFVAGQRGTVDAGELRLCLNESAANLGLCGVECKTAVTAEGPLSPARANAVYDLFEAAVERSLESLSSLLLFVRQRDEALCVNLSAACDADMTGLCRDISGLTAVQDEDGLWYLTAEFSGEGDPA